MVANGDGYCDNIGKKVVALPPSCQLFLNNERNSTLLPEYGQEGFLVEHGLGGAVRLVVFLFFPYVEIDVGTGLFIFTGTTIVKIVTADMGHTGADHTALLYHQCPHQGNMHYF